MSLAAGTRHDAEEKGRRAESLVALYLRFLGWRILDRRYRVGRGSGAGEVDIVARRRDVVAFIEVKARRTVEEAMESVTPRQRTRIARGAEAWLRDHPQCATCTLRFDVVAVLPGRRPIHLQDAWRPEDG